MTARSDAALALLRSLRPLISGTPQKILDHAIELLEPTKGALRQRKHASKNKDSAPSGNTSALTSAQPSALISGLTSALTSAQPPSPRSPLPLLQGSFASPASHSKNIVGVSEEEAPDSLFPSGPSSGSKTEQIATTRARAKASSEPSALTLVWEAYALEYAARYGVEPTRNARVNAQLAQFCKRVPAAEAPAIAAAYVRSRNARYVAAGHAVGCLLQDAEKLRTEALTGRNGTAHGAARQDREADKQERYAELLDWERARNEEKAALAAEEPTS